MSETQSHNDTADEQELTHVITVCQDCDFCRHTVYENYEPAGPEFDTLAQQHYEDTGTSHAVIEIEPSDSLPEDEYPEVAKALEVEPRKLSNIRGVNPDKLFEECLELYKGGGD